MNQYKRNDDLDAGMDVILSVMKSGQTLAPNEIAEILDCKPSYIYNLIDRALKKLSKTKLKHWR